MSPYEVGNTEAKRLARTLVWKERASDPNAIKHAERILIERTGWSPGFCGTLLGALIVRLTQDESCQRSYLARQGWEPSEAGGRRLVIGEANSLCQCPAQPPTRDAVRSRPRVEVTCRLCNTIWWRLSSGHPWVCAVCHPCPHPHDRVEWTEEVRA